MSLGTPRDLFVHELSDLMSAEHIMLKTMQDMASVTDNASFRKSLQDHAKETETQIERLTKVFELLGESPEETTCPAAEGLKEEHESLKKENPSGNVKELGLLAGANKSEHYEIATYLTLRQMAQDLGETDIADMLNESLQEEKEMARAAQSLAADIGAEVKKSEKDS